jgi:hypothetical protein
MRIRRMTLFAMICCVACLPGSMRAQSDGGTPHLARQGNATQLIVDGKPFLILGGELSNNAATALGPMEPVWPRLVEGNLNTVLLGVSWAQFEPEEGKFNYTLVDGVIAKARENHMHIVFLWFGSWKNGTSSYPPYWLKKDYVRFPRIQIGEGKTVSITGPVETLSSFSDATRDADAKAFGSLMAHIKQVDGTEHTVLMMQVENEVGVLRDSRDRSPAANRVFAGQVPAELMNYLESHKDTLAPELRELWLANGSRKSGTWEEVFGPGKPATLELPVQTTPALLGQLEHERSWQRLHWASDEIFMAWNYARYIEKVVEAGKAAYNIPMYSNAWLQQPWDAWPGTYPSGGPLPQVHDVWRAGAPQIDILAPDIYIEYFDDVCERFTRNGNPLFIPEAITNPANAYVAFGKYNTIGFSPFGIDYRPIPADLAETYRLLNQMSPMILAHQGTDSMTAVSLREGDAPKKVKLGNYTLTLSYVGRKTYIVPQPNGHAPASSQPGATPSDGPLQAAVILIAEGPDEFYFAGGGVRIVFTADTPGPKNVGIGDVQEGTFTDGKWVVTRELAGDDDAQSENLTLRPYTAMRVTLYRFP